jgi:CheY-like chemotaxis protein
VVVPSIVVTTILVFILVDLLLRVLLKKVRGARTKREREQALDTGLRLDVSDEAPSLKRVELDHPHARILAVDDEKTILDSFRKMLVLGGYSIDTVETGSEALGLVRKRDYDFVFTDLRMPGMDGVEVTRAVRHLRPEIARVCENGTDQAAGPPGKTDAPRNSPDRARDQGIRIPVRAERPGGNFRVAGACMGKDRNEWHCPDRPG